MQTQIKIVKTDEDLGLIYGEAYPSLVIDSDLDYMTSAEVRKMAHKFMVNGNSKMIDVQHDNSLIDACVVESWIVEEPSEIYRQGSWAICVKVEDEAVWKMVKDGELNGFSIEAMVTSVVEEIEIDMPEFVSGVTMETNGHVHDFIVEFSDEGIFAGGWTNVVDNHDHKITRGTSTEKEQGHSHRFDFVDTVYLEDFSNE